jgi:hypothetical protein
MTTPVIITICLLLLLAYLFDISASRTRIPSVILLLLLGWGMRQLTALMEINLPNLGPVLPLLGTVGLILIVLEGSLELELNRKKLPFLGKTLLISILPMLVFSAALAYAFNLVGQTGWKTGLANAIPLAVISSAIAIPTAQHLSSKQKEFITYESSLSDIFGVILFNFITLNDEITGESTGQFAGGLLLMLLISFAATLVLAYLLSRIKHHVKFVPIILITVLIYAITKIYHLPGLIFILLFGIFLGNLDEFRQYRFIEKLQPDILDKEVHKFKELTSEIAFLIRALFFLLFGYLIETSELLNTETMLWAFGITAGIFLIRFIFLKIAGIAAMPVLFIAPRGLITILLFLSIPASQLTALANKSLVIQVILLTAFTMMTGMLLNKKETKHH